MTEQTAVTTVTETPVSTINPMAMVQQAVTSGASVEVLSKLMDLQERWEASQGRKAFDAAIALAKGEIPLIFKDKHVGFNQTGYRHESLGQIATVVDPILNRHGLSYRYKASQDGGRVVVTCVLSHVDGYSEETTLSAGADDSGKKNSIQAIGSTTTYLQRYTLKLALGLATTDRDDDGAASEDAPISGAAQAAIDSIALCASLNDLTEWQKKNDPIVQKMDRNDADACVRAWKARAREIREGAAQ